MDEFDSELIDGMTPKEHRNYVIMGQRLKISQLLGTVYKLREEIENLKKDKEWMRTELDRLQDKLTDYENNFDDFQVTD